MPINPDDRARAAPARDVYSVSRVNREVRALLERGLGVLWVEGELSNFSQPASGHWYFSLKDRDAQLRCAMFRMQNSLVGTWRSAAARSEEHTSELQSQSNLVCRLLLEKKNKEQH